MGDSRLGGPEAGKDIGPAGIGYCSRLIPEQRAPLRRSGHCRFQNDLQQAGKGAVKVFPSAGSSCAESPACGSRARLLPAKF